MIMPKKFLRLICTLAIILLLITVSSVEAVVRDGRVDPSLSIVPISFSSAPKISDFAPLPDGKILVAGGFTNISGGVANSIARLNADGSFDETFHGDASSYVSRILLGPNGEIYISGNFLQYAGITRDRIARLNQDGSLDTSFNPDVGTEYVQIAAIQPDGKLIVNGTFTSIGGVPRQRIARLFPDGSVDLSFDAGTGTDVSTVYKGLVQPDGKIVLCGEFHSYNGVPRQGVVRLNEDGSLDIEFVPGLPVFSNIVFDAALAPDGKIYAAGDIGNAETVYRLNADGTRDATFDTGGSDSLGGGQVYRVLLQADGKVMIGGGFQTYIVRGVSYPRQGLFRFNTDGSADVDFTPRVSGDASQTVWALSRQSDNKILVGGVFTDLNVQRTGGIGRIYEDGSTDTSFVGFLGNLSTIDHLVVTADDKVLIAGTFASLGTSRHDNAARLNADGTLDESFQLDPRVNAPVSDFAEQPDGKILIGGASDGFMSFAKGIWRVNANGSLDSTFQAQISTTFSSSVLTVAVQPDGKVLIGGNFTTVNGTPRVGLARLNANGSIDTSFTSNLAGTVRTVLLLNDGKILVGGHINVSGNPTQNIFRLNSDGSVDESFAVGTGAGDEVFSLSLLPDNRIYVAGAFRTFNGMARTNIVRLQSDGTLDTSFRQPRLTGITTFSIVPLPDGKIIIGGEMNASIDASPRQKILRLFADGTVDYSFDVHSVIYRGSAGRIFDLGRQSDGRLLAAGQFDTISGTQRAGLTRLLNFDRPTPPIFDFDGDGTSDLAVFRPGNGVWYRRVSYSTIMRSAQWGLGGDRIVPADYDGDYLTDIGVYRPSNGTWYWRNSSDNSISAIQFGIAEDLPVPADYDGDHKADVAVFRPSNGTWYWLNSGDGSFHAFQFGIAEDKPTVGDFDGDDRSDIAVFRPSTGTWYRINSSDGSFLGQQFGTQGDLITPADFDGDHRTDLAVFRPTEGYWYIRGSIGGTFTAVQFGTDGDVPVAGDLDGDERADLAVFRPSNGTWYRTDSSTGAFLAFPIGITGDVPVEAAFRY